MLFFFLSLGLLTPATEEPSIAEFPRTLGVFDIVPSKFAPKMSVSACYARHHNQYLLLQRRSDGIWGVPGGKLEEGESPFNAIFREFFEETGIMLKQDFVKFIKTVYISDPKKDFVFHIYVYDFEEKPGVILSKEHQSYIWKTLEEYTELPLIWGEQEVFEKYITNLK